LIIKRITVSSTIALWGNQSSWNIPGKIPRLIVQFVL
jgi:hypothetical protein